MRAPTGSGTGTESGEGDWLAAWFQVEEHKKSMTLTASTKKVHAIVCDAQRKHAAERINLG